MDLADISTQMLFTTIPIWVKKNGGNVSTGTSFILNSRSHQNPEVSYPFLVTNEHIVSNSKYAIVEFVSATAEGNPAPGARLRVEINADRLTAFTNKERDIAVIPIGDVVNNLSEQDNPVFYRSVDETILPEEGTFSNLSAVEEILFVGYPSNFYDEENSSPLVRRGITASPPWFNFRGLPKYVIDAGVFPGSSGSPVFIFNKGSYPTKEGIVIGTRFLFMGLLSSSLKREEYDSSEIYLGLGLVLKPDSVFSYVNYVRNQIESAQKLHG